VNHSQHTAFKQDALVVEVLVAEVSLLQALVAEH